MQPIQLTTPPAKPTARPRPRTPFPMGRALIYLLLIVGAVGAVLPFLYMATTSLKSYGSVINNSL